MIPLEVVAQMVKSKMVGEPEKAGQKNESIDFHALSSETFQYFVRLRV